jgi:hypothetical protein
MDRREEATISLHDFSPGTLRSQHWQQIGNQNKAGILI